MKIVGEIALWKIIAAYGPAYGIFQNAIIFAIFGRLPKNVTV